ncbi:dinitrogenase iron-molybdenum cofactor biosynthesis protein [Labilibacter sediminis]|nr:dinitrogenase iron-molybdenum cofactor biosynthesis protein [Labilibacter sediminis]
MKKVALPSKKEMVDNHFGHCEKFIIYSLSDENEILDSAFFKGEEGCGCKSNLASDLKSEGVEILLAGGIGQGAINKLKTEGIEVFTGYKGETKAVLEQWLGGNKGNYSVCPPHDFHGGNCHAHH